MFMISLFFPHLTPITIFFSCLHCFLCKSMRVDTLYKYLDNINNIIVSNLEIDLNDVY